MSVENFDQIDGALAFLGGDTPEHCFLCGKPLIGITVFWQGANGQTVALHPDCGERFAAHLIRDAINAQLIRKGQPVTRGIGTGL